MPTGRALGVPGRSAGARGAGHRRLPGHHRSRCVGAVRPVHRGTPRSSLRVVLLDPRGPGVAAARAPGSRGFTEIRAADLAFTPAETAELFASNGFHLRADQLDRIMGRTEGWPAGVRVAALSIDPQDAESGITRSVRRAEVSRITSSARSSGPSPRPIGTSCSDRATEMVNGDLADQLTGRSDGRHTLRETFRGQRFHRGTRTRLVLATSPCSATY